MCIFPHSQSSLSEESKISTIKLSEIVKVFSKMSVRFSLPGVFKSSQIMWFGSFSKVLNISDVESEFPGCREISFPALSKTINSSKSVQLRFCKI